MNHLGTLVEPMAVFDGDACLFCWEDVDPWPDPGSPEVDGLSSIDDEDAPEPEVEALDLFSDDIDLAMPVFMLCIKQEIKHLMVMS